jgi:hypothetical protein
MYGRSLGLRTLLSIRRAAKAQEAGGLIMMFTAPQTEAGPMQTLTIEVTQDHIDRLSKAKKPVLGIAELIWNSVDADATVVDVRLNRNGLGSLDSIEVIDNGLGITMPDAQEGFGHLGGSWKQHDHLTKREKRILHGRQGQGRFRAFALCERAEWDTTYLANGALSEYKIIGTSDDKRRFTITDETPSSRGGTGTTATLTNLIPQQTSLDGAKAVPELNKLFALYLKQYPQVRLSYDGDAVDPSILEDTRTNYPLPAFATEDGRILVLGREVSTEFGGRIDILGLDSDGNTVVIECKRDRTPRDIIAQILDYASWIAHLSTRQVHEIAYTKLSKPLEGAFRERFGAELPEALNESHSLVIVAGEFDASSRRIVEYLAEVHDIAINTAFFSVFEHNGETLLATDWLLDQEQVTQRAESKAKAPWSGLWYYNVGQDNARNWEDMRKHSFIAAGGSRYYSDFLKKLSPGDNLFAYQKQAGYVGYGIVTGQPLPCKDFVVDETPILNLPLEAHGTGHDVDDLDKCEYLVAVEWKKTFPLSEAKTFAGVFANQNIVCKLRDTATIEFLRQVFPQEHGQLQG